VGAHLSLSKNKNVTKFFNDPWKDSLAKRPSLRIHETKFGTWNMLDLVGVRWGRSGTEPAGKCIFFYGKGNENHELGKGFFCAYEINISS
jgi:hypothetical protein